MSRYPSIVGVDDQRIGLEGADVDGGRQRIRPRWSVVGIVRPVIELLPAPMAGLPGSKAMVWVGPP